MSWFWIDVAIVGMFCVCRMVQNLRYKIGAVSQLYYYSGICNRIVRE